MIPCAAPGVEEERVARGSEILEQAVQNPVIKPVLQRIAAVHRLPSVVDLVLKVGSSQLTHADLSLASGGVSRLPAVRRQTGSYAKRPRLALSV
jgi:hypothetical protein